MEINRHNLAKQLSRIIPMFAIAAILLSALVQMLTPKNAYADLVSDWNAGNIMSDAVMNNKYSLKVSSIQSFLNSKVTNCDTNGAQLSEFGGPDLNGDGKVQRWEWGKSKYNQTKFPCLKDYTLSGKSAAQIIYDKAQKYNINPQVLIVLLQKEQSLVTDTWPLNVQYKTATGYGCPDTAPCDSQYFGLSNQLDWAAKMFRAILDNSPTWYTPYELGNNYIQYNPSSSCGGSTVNIQNRATQALYNYTPYQPNKAALKAGWGSASCGAYGNRNFYLYFISWFGNTRNPAFDALSQRYSALTSDVKATLGNPLNGPRCTLIDDGCYQKYEHGAITWTKSTGAWESYGPIRDRWTNLGNEMGEMGYPTGPVRCGMTDNGCYQKFGNNAILWTNATGAWESKGNIRLRWSELGYENSLLGYPTGPEKQTTTGGWYQRYENGYVIGNKRTGYWESYGPIRDRWVSLGYETGEMGYPTGPVNCGIKDNGCYQKYGANAILSTNSTGAWESKGNIRLRWAELGYENGILGYPIGPEKQTTTGGWYQKYQNGYIIGKRTLGYWESYGPIRDRWVSLGYETGSMGYPLGPVIQKNSTTYYQQYQHNRIYLTPPNTTTVGR